MGGETRGTLRPYSDVEARGGPMIKQTKKKKDIQGGKEKHVAVSFEGQGRGKGVYVPRHGRGVPYGPVIAQHQVVYSNIL